MAADVLRPVLLHAPRADGAPPGGPAVKRREFLGRMAAGVAALRRLPSWPAKAARVRAVTTVACRAVVVGHGPAGTPPALRRVGGGRLRGGAGCPGRAPPGGAPRCRVFDDASDLSALNRRAGRGSVAVRDRPCCRSRQRPSGSGVTPAAPSTPPSSRSCAPGAFTRPAPPPSPRHGRSARPATAVRAAQIAAGRRAGGALIVRDPGWTWVESA